MKLQSIIVGICSVFILASCNNQPSGPSAIETQKKVYKQATELGDFMTAASSLQMILALDSSQKNYLDTLANVYYTAHLYAPALKTCEKWNKTNAPSENILRIKGSSYEIIGNIDSAYEAYDKLFLMNPKNKYLFKVALFELLLGKQTGFAKLDKVRAAKDLAQDSVEIFWQEQNFMQYVKLNAALTWLDAAMQIKSGNIPAAKKGLEMALLLDPNFEMARYYVDNFNKPPQQGGQR